MSFRQPKVLGGIFFLTLLAAGLATSIAGRTVSVQATVVAGERTSLKEPLTVQFSFPVNRRQLNPRITPDTEGTWQWSGGLPGGHLARTITFTPETVWLPEQEYSVTLDGLGPFLDDQPTQTTKLALVTPPLPIVESSTVEENATDVLPDAEIGLTLDRPITDEVYFSFRLEPSAEVTVSADPTNRRYLVRPTNPLVAGTTYRLIGERELIHRSTSSGTVVKRDAPQQVFERPFTIKVPPHLTGLVPSGDSVDPSISKIAVTFSTPMNRSAVEEAITLAPRPKGEWTWEGDQTYSFVLTEQLALDTVYEIKLPAGVPDQTGYQSKEPLIAQFRTAGALKVVGATPNQKSGVAVGASVKLTFDQEPDQDSVAGHISVSPSIPFVTKKEGRSIIIVPTAPWAHNTKYTVVLRRGAIGVYNRPSVSETIVTFTTEEKVVLIPVAWDRQDRALSCEAAALKMALAGKGVIVSEDEIMSLVGYDSTPRTSGGWGDPDQAFVGDINGAQNTTGYGVHWAPIARAANAWRVSRAVTGLSLQDAARELEAGNPIVVWGVTGPAYYDPWVTPSGRTIAAWKGEHARTLIGFRGSVENPTSFIINDPLVGRVTWSAAKFKSDWGKFGNAGVIVY